MNQSICLSEERPASLSQSQDFVKDLMTLEAISCSHLVQSLTNIAPDGWFGKTSPVSCRRIEEGILLPSSGRWKNSGMGSPTGFLTLNTSEWPKDAVVCSLSDILETGDLPQRYFLSAKACQGILRRAEKRGKTLPPQLEAALRMVAQGTGSEAETRGASL